MFAKPILLNSLTSCDFVFSEQTQNLKETTKTLYIEAIFVFFVQKRNIEKIPDKTTQFKQDYFHFRYVTGFLRFDSWMRLFSTAMPRSLSATRRPNWRSSIHPRKALQHLLGPRIPQKAPSVLSIPLSSPHFFCIGYSRWQTRTWLLSHYYKRNKDTINFYQ